MIEIDKQDFLFKHLQKLGVGENDIEKYYLEFATNGVTNAKDFKDFVFSKLSQNIDDELDEELLKDLLPYFVDLKKVKVRTDTKKMIKDYTETKDEKLKEQIVNSKLKDVLYLAYLYKTKLPDEDIMDIVQICNIGLLKAIEKFDLNAKITFDDYIHFWINAEIENNFTKEKM